MSQRFNWHDGPVGPAQTRVLLVDDDKDLLRALHASLEQEGYQVFSAESGARALDMVYDCHPNVVVMDVLMPHMDGLETCLRVHSISNIPVIFLTARRFEGDIVKGLNYGADDYLIKPFSVRELMARMEAVLRRAPDLMLIDPVAYDDDVLSIDVQSRTVRKRGEIIALSPKEFQLLACLVRNAGRLVSHTDLLREIWGPGYEDETSYLSIYVRYLREKIEDDPGAPHYIRTRFRVGYSFSGQRAAHPPDQPQ